MKKSLNENLRQIALLKFENHSIKYKKYTKNALQHRINYDSKTQHFDTSAVESVIDLVMKVNPNAPYFNEEAK